MSKYIRAVQGVFGIPWLVFGIQHFIYAEFVARLVPAYLPGRMFFALFTGAAMIAAGISLLTGVASRLAAASLGLMLLIFLCLIHLPKVADDPAVVMTWTRALQDVALAATAFMLAGLLSRNGSEPGWFRRPARASLNVFALLMVIFGVHQFFDVDFLVAKAATYLPLRMVWIYTTGAVMAAAGIGVLGGKKAPIAVFAAAVGAWMLLLNLMLHIYQIADSAYDPRRWTAGMIDLAITCGVFMTAFAVADRSDSTPHE